MKSNQKHIFTNLVVVDAFDDRILPLVEVEEAVWVVELHGRQDVLVFGCAHLVEDVVVAFLGGLEENK